MSEMAKKTRAAMRAKANRLGGKGDPGKKVDASGWTPPEPLNTTAKTGARPVRARIYKAGGSVQGDRGPRRADRKARATGGSVVDDYINRDGVKANAKLGKPHVGAFKKGGRTGRDMGGAAGMPIQQPVGPNRMEFGGVQKGGMIGLKKGGAAKHCDEAEDKKLVKQMVDKSALKRKDGGKASGTYFGGTRPTGGRMPHAEGGKIKGKTSSGDSYNYEDLTDKQRGLAQRLGGHNPERKSTVRTREDVERAARAAGGRTGKKGKTAINIHINTPQGQPTAMPVPMPGGPVKPPQAPPPMPPAGGPGGAPPMGMAPPGGMPPMPPGGMPPMPRKRGGRTGFPHMTAGAGSGLGRLEKAKNQENSRR